MYKKELKNIIKIGKNVRNRKGNMCSGIGRIRRKIQVEYEREIHVHER